MTNRQTILIKDVPKEQRKLFLDFHRDHPYSTMHFQGREREYLSCGEGKKAVIFLHGALVKPDMWFYPILELEKRYRIIAPLFTPQTMGAQEAMGFVRAILVAEAISTAMIVGYSYGGGVAQLFAEAHPEMVDKLVLSHTGLAGREGSTEQIERTKKVVRFLPFFVMKKKLKGRIERVPASDWNAFHRAYFTQITAQLTRRIFLDYLESVLSFEDESKHLLADGREWQGETVLLGTRGDKDAFEFLETLSRLYPNAKSYIFEQGGGHHMVFLFPEEYTRVLSQYLE
jgi:pimeloyl-ACP methyl ester carboxylesterase